MKKRIFCIMLSVVLALSGCGKTNPTVADLATQQEAARAQRALREVNQNDYRGAVMRAEAIKSALMGVMDSFNERNIAIETENPSDYWNSDSYMYLGVNLLNNESWAATVYFNEVETTWDEAVDATRNLYRKSELSDSLTVSNFQLNRLETNCYAMSFKENSIFVPFYKDGDESHTFITRYVVNYDANHDWAQCIRYREASNHVICDGLFEYARISDTEFVVQTSTERMYIRYEDGLYDYGTASENASTEDAAENTQPAVLELHNPLAEKPIAEFYYTQLNGEPRYEYAEIVLPENDHTEASYSYYSENSDSFKKGFTNVDENDKWVCVYEPEMDSIFNDMSVLGADWVFADTGRFKQSISYYDDMMVVKTENQLVNILECTNFLADGTTENFIEEIYVPEIILDMSDEEILAMIDEENRIKIPALRELSTNGFNFGEKDSFENIIENRNMQNVNYNGKNYNIMDNRELDYLDRDLLNGYILYEREVYIDNTYALPQGRMYFASTIDSDDENNHFSDNDNYYSMLYEYEIQDDYTIKYNSYYMVSDNPDCMIMLQNIKPRSTTRSRVEAAYGQPVDFEMGVDIIDEEGFTEYTVSFSHDIVAYRCENGIIYIRYDDNDIVEVVGVYCFAEPQSLDMVYTPQEETKE